MVLHLVGGYMKKQLIYSLLLVFLTTECVTIRSDMDGKFSNNTKKYLNAKKVDIVFVVSHLRQAKGFDAIPKLEKKHQIISGFDDILKDASQEISNIEKYTTYTELSTDSSEPKRLALKDTLIATHDFSIEIQIRKEWSFAKHFLGTLGSIFSATIAPIAYTTDFSVSVGVNDSDGYLLGNYTRNAKTTLWLEAFLLPIYPFHTEKRKTEEIYVEILHDIFNQIETEKILTKKE
jgi:hypothetical protein